MKQLTSAGEHRAVLTLVEAYCDGLHHGSVKKLRAISHPALQLITQGQHRSLEEWLRDVAERPSPASLEHAYRYAVRSVDIVGDQAFVSLHCPLYHFQYLDFLGLLKENNQWRISTKLYTDLTAYARDNTQQHSGEDHALR